MYNNCRGITLLEIMAALLILAFAFIPIIGVISGGTRETDVSESYIFAQTTARNILDSLLDDVPFSAIRVSGANIADIDDTNNEPNVGELFPVADPPYDISHFKALIGNTTGDDYARGQLTDDRGNKYKIKVFVFPVASNDPPDMVNDMTFRYLPRPKFEEQPNWYTTTSEYVAAGAQTPYEMPLETLEIKSARELGADPGPDGSFCVIKRILLRIRWQGTTGPERSISIYTAKANLDKKVSP